MNHNNYFAKFYPMMLNCSIMTEMDINGIEEKGVFIPFRFNSFYIDKHGNPVLNLTALERKPNPFNQSHMFVQRFSERRSKEIERMGVKPTVCGSLAPMIKKMAFSNLNRKNWVNIDDILNKEEQE